MKIVSASDIHGRESAFYLFDHIIKEEKPDVVCLAGDITNFGPPEFASKLIKFIEEKKVRLVAVPGNCDPDDVTEELERLQVSVHENKKELYGETFAGFGGSTDTPFYTPSEFDENTIYSRIAEVIEPKCILVTHSPPHGVVDSAPKARHIGSRAIRHAIEKFGPVLALCGHAHGARGKEELAGATVVNAGPALDGNYAVIVVEEHKVKSVKLKNWQG